MLVEINLLPQKEPRKRGFIITLSGMAAIFLLLGGYYIWQVQTTKTEIANLDKQIEMTKKIAEAEQKNAQSNKSTMSVSILKNAVEWANSYPIQTVPVMQHLTSLLPERGFIQSFGYTEAGTVSLTVQFDSAREAAYFLDHLNESDWIEESSLSSLNAQEMEASTESTTNNTENTETEDQTKLTNDSNNIIVLAPDPNDPTRFVLTTVEQAETNAAETTDSQKAVNNNNLPRYIGQYEIKFKKETIKKLISKSGAEEEGVTES